MAKKPTVALIILTTNALAMTREQLVDVSKLQTNTIEATCIVVDNGSADGTEDALKNFKLANMNYKFIQSGSNLGFAGGNNVGIKYAVNQKFDYILLLNNDLILPKDMVTKLVEYMQTSPSVGLASPKMYFAKGYEFHKDRYKDSEKGRVIWYAGGDIDKNNVYTSHKGVDEVDKGQYDEIQETDVANGAAVIIRREVFEKIGLLDASFFLYWEDADFSERAKRAEYKVMYFPKTWMWHKVSASTGGSGSPTNDYFLTRNRFFYSMHYSTLRTKFAVVRDTLKLIFIGRQWQRWGAIDAILGRRGMGQWKYRN